MTHFSICHSFLDFLYREVFGTVLDFPLFEKEIEIYCRAQRVRQCIGSIEMKSCGCLTNNRGELCSRVSEIWDEVCEVCEAGSWEELKDEVSDVMFGFGRLFGYMCGRVYVGMWFDERHVKKIEGRMEEYGCVRSKRHLVAGMCPCMGSEK